MIPFFAHLNKEEWLKSFNIDRGAFAFFINTECLYYKFFDCPTAAHIHGTGDFEVYFNTFAEVRERDVTNGTVVGLSDREVLVDIGFKAEGMIDRGEFSVLPEIGDVIEVFVVTFYQ